jgi:hypothetical protein
MTYCRKVLAAVCGSSKKAKGINVRRFAGAVLRRSAAVPKSSTKINMRRLCGACVRETPYYPYALRVAD